MVMVQHFDLLNPCRSRLQKERGAVANITADVVPLAVVVQSTLRTQTVLCNNSSSVSIHYVVVVLISLSYFTIVVDPGSSVGTS